MLKQVFSFILAMVWLGTTNHCFIQEALASKQIPADHSCCEKQESKESNSTPNSRADNNTSDKICCGLFAKTDRNTASLGVAVDQIFYQLYLSVSWELAAPLSYRSIPNVVSFAQAPPGGSPRLLYSLSLAPNAPPVQN